MRQTEEGIKRLTPWLRLRPEVKEDHIFLSRTVYLFLLWYWLGFSSSDSMKISGSRGAEHIEREKKKMWKGRNEKKLLRYWGKINSTWFSCKPWDAFLGTEDIEIIIYGKTLKCKCGLNQTRKHKGKMTSIPTWTRGKDEEPGRFFKTRKFFEGSDLHHNPSMQGGKPQCHTKKLYFFFRIWRRSVV